VEIFQNLNECGQLKLPSRAFESAHAGPATACRDESGFDGAGQHEMAAIHGPADRHFDRSQSDAARTRRIVARVKDYISDIEKCR
jgi:hypothetical protein